ncbi:TonB-dependent receptor [Paraurantiacibacter namhicola]|uniref:Putative TonB-dependent receptor n=1 Tax=Paraurantiacibacter namhicola TaxID=645517 RepID=A0A1C7D6A7_9SPHN|nr:TonB-dependent receptor [Paraurantiacibacter namhicola]ANU07026.1 putative TonB-dependent receptor precursor [Paraurantiacibacter namhicola]
MILSRLLAGTAALTFLVPNGAALAQDAEVQRQDTAETSQERASGDDFHGEIVVRAGGLARLDMLAGTSVLQGDELQRNLDGQIGEVLAKLPGVSATSFSPGASRPVLRGFQGDRVRVLVDGIGAIDASNTSADHAVTIDPLTAERIEVLRGPAVLLYGSSAIGGAVNVIDRRIPQARPDEPLHVDAIVGFDTAHHLREGGVSFDLPVGGGFALHVDGSIRRTDNVEIPGFAVSGPLRADLLAEAAEEEADEPEEAAELREAAGRKGSVPGTYTATESAGVGLAWFGNGANLGVSFGYYDSDYGIPLRPGTEHAHEEDGAAPGAEEEEEIEDVRIGLVQKRVDFRGGVQLGGGFFEELTTRWGYADYTHTEFENGEVGTVFDVEGVEGRVELVQRERNGWRGSIGAQFLYKDFVAVGEEAYVPPNTTEQFAVFTLQEVELGNAEFEFGARYENVSLENVTSGLKRDFDAYSLAGGLSYSPSYGWRVGVNLSHSERAPTSEELFADGPHIASQQFEIGDAGLVKEKANGVEGYARWNSGPADFGIAVYHTWFDDFIYLQSTGMEEDGLPVFMQRQQDAKHFGVEAEATFPLLRGDGWSLVGEARGDYVRATLDNGDPVPRIPPVSLLGAAEYRTDAFDVRAEVQWFGEQDRVAPLELPTDSFALVNMALTWKPVRGDGNLTVILQGNNLFDVTGRRHASFTKDYVPMAGRNVKVTARLSL